MKHGDIKRLPLDSLSYAMTADARLVAQLSYTDA